MMGRWLLILVSASIPLQVCAQDRNARLQAQALFREGNSLFQQGDYPSALELFRRAYEILPSARILLNLATTLRQVGREAEAADAYERALAAESDLPAGARAEAQATLHELDSSLGRLHIIVDVDGARVSVDGRPLGASPLPGAVRVILGPHSVVAEMEGVPPVVTTVEAVAGQVREVSLTIARPEPVQAAAGEPGPDVRATTEPRMEPVPEPAAERETARPRAPLRSASSGGRTTGWLLIGAGAAAALGALATGLIASAQFSRLDAQCPERVCPESLREDALAADRWAITSTVLTGVAIAGAAVGLILLLTQSSSGTGLEADLSWLTLGAGPLGLSFQGNL